MKKGQVFFQDVELTSIACAKSFYQRAKGLLGSSALESKQGLLIYRCGSVHTFFMNYAIDVVFMNKDYKVKKIIKGLKPWRITWPSIGSSLCLEMGSGALDDFYNETSLKIKVGEVLDVRT